MPYKKRYTKRTAKKPFRYKAADSIAGAWKAIKYIKRQINVEHKYADYDAGATVLAAGTVYPLFNPSQGDGQTQRDGDSVKLQSLNLRMTISHNTSATGSYIRCIIFRGHQERAVAYTTAMLLQTATIDSPKTYENRFRTKILHDQTYNISNVGINSKFIRITKKLFGHVVFTPANTTIEDGGLYMLLISNEATNVPSANWYSRTTFTDN